ncbi:MAG TPA: glucoamylase family protein [Bellilinea sp.]|nr:glucoamylase family protein [Bellilinea sp.]
MAIETGERFKECEYSSIDTTICLNGVITAAAYFHDSEISQKTHQLLERVDWPLIIFEENDKTLFRMAYNPDAQGYYVHNKPGFISQWDMAAEQKMMYLQASRHIDAGVARKLYADFHRDKRIYTGQEVIIHPGGGSYVYQCSEAWLDVERYLDLHGVDWFRNTRLAAQANRAFCLEHLDRFKTYHETSWGLSAGDSPHGYAVFGGSPSLWYPNHDGTVSIWGLSPTCPLSEETIALVEFLFTYHPQTWGEYGFYDAYNVDVAPPWYSSELYGVDKGSSIIMIEKYLSRLGWETYTDST